MDAQRLELIRLKAEGLKNAILIDPEDFADEVLALVEAYQRAQANDFAQKVGDFLQGTVTAVSSPAQPPNVVTMVSQHPTTGERDIVSAILG